MLHLMLLLFQQLLPAGLCCHIQWTTMGSRRVLLTALMLLLLLLLQACAAVAALAGIPHC
jgi:hypothetical protein